MISKRSSCSARGLFASVLTASLAACAAPVPSTQAVSAERAEVGAPQPAAGRVVVSGGHAGGVSLSVPLRATARRLMVAAGVTGWGAADVFEYRLSLTRENAADAPLVAVAPQKAPVVSEVAFVDLMPGAAYRVALEAWGNAGGTAADQRLNAVTPTEETFSLAWPGASSQLSLVATLDPRPFSATVVVRPSVTIAPAGYRLRFVPPPTYGLDDVNQLVVTVEQATSTGGVFQPMSPALSATLAQKASPVEAEAVFANLAAGKVYRFKVEALGNTGGSAPTTLLNSATATQPTVDLTGDALAPEHLLTPAVMLDGAIN